MEKLPDITQSDSIPVLNKSTGWKEIPIEECQQPLVLLNEVHPNIVVDAKYYEQGLAGAEPLQYLRQEVVEKLVLVADMLPEGYKLVIWDAWRPLEVQQSLFDAYKSELSSKHPEKSEEELNAETQTYVSIPNPSPTKPSPHYTGGAVDLSIIGPDGALLDMGTEFDHFGPEAATRYLEEHPDVNPVALENRRLLYSLMVKVGFSSYDEEWWHFDYGNQFDAKRTGKSNAIYGPISK